MKKIILATVTAVTLLGSAGVASATEYRGWGWGWGQGAGERREARQESAIEQGRRNGTLTASEYRALQAEQARIDRLQNAAKSDGYVSAAERARISAAQNSAARHIYQETHDREGRSPWYRRWY